MIDAGSLRCPILIQVPGPPPDNFGPPTAVQWTTLLQTRAAITAVTSKEVYAVGAGFAGQITHKVVMRYPVVTITSGMRVLYGTRTFNVQAVLDLDERRRELHLMVEETSK